MKISAASVHSKPFQYEPKDVPEKVLAVMEILAKKHYRACWRIAMDCLVAGWMMRSELTRTAPERGQAGETK